MAAIPSYFSDFLSDIRLTEAQIQDCKTGHSTLRKRLLEDDDLATIIIDTFLQGSYRRSTAVRPPNSKKLSDVDVIVVTTLDRFSTTPQQALNKFKQFLQKHYPSKYEIQGRSWAIKLSYVALDLVPTSAPSEAGKSMIKSASVTTVKTLSEAEDWVLKPSWKPEEERPTSTSFYKSLAEEKEWQSEPLWIPDRNVKEWDQTDPLSQILVTRNKNRAGNRHFVNVVKCLKWWRNTQKAKPKYPKSYPLEHLAWTCCPDGIKSVAEGVVQVLEQVRDRYKVNADLKETPFLPDHGVPTHNVLHRVSGDDWSAFHAIVSEAADLARKAFDEEEVRESAIFWKELFGDKFPDPPGEPDKGGKQGGFTPRERVSIIGGGRFG
ncbi:MAG: nucleotidyltransferase [Deltaproteobacteria bacterium]|nr:nucleotidyltransferase [Deltaproteobacteria bacterium]